MKASDQKITGILLAGGESSRMGREKGLINVGQHPLYTYPLRILEKVCDEIIISTCKGFSLPVKHKQVCDEIKGIGPIGGIIMGAGFIIGGFCPGTSVCAASIGKIDAMFFVIGLFIGIFIFAEGYPLWEGFYKAKFMGIPTLSQVLGLKDGIVVLGIIIAAMGMYWVGEWAESKFPG